MAPQLSNVGKTTPAQKGTRSDNSAICFYTLFVMYQISVSGSAVCGLHYNSSSDENIT